MGRVGGGIATIAVGAILTFGVDADLGALRLNVVGWILMATGVAFVALGFMGQAKAREMTQTRETPDGTERETRRETHRTL